MPTWKLQRRMTADLKKTVGIIKCTAKWQQTESKYCDFFVYTKYGFYVERVTFNQTISDEIAGKLSWFWENYVSPNIAKVTFVLGEREEIDKKTFNVTSDVDFSFSTTVNTKPISIKLKQKRLPKEEILSKQNKKRQLWQCIYVGSAKLN